MPTLTVPDSRLRKDLTAVLDIARLLQLIKLERRFVHRVTERPETRAFFLVFSVAVPGRTKRQHHYAARRP